MLIRFRVKNFLSFKDEVELTMFPGKNRQHINHIVSFGEGRHATKLLKTAVIYGANASGKSNLIKAMAFAKALIIEGTKPKELISVPTFKLDSTMHNQPSRFEFEFRKDNYNYLYGFEINSHRVDSEWLYEIKSTTNLLLYERKTDEKDHVKAEFGNLGNIDKKSRSFLDFIVMGTRSNQLLLTESINKNIQLFDNIYNWFRNSLVIIFPETHYRITSENTIEINKISKYLEEFGTGINGIELMPISEEEIDIPKAILEDVLKDLNDSPTSNNTIEMLGPKGTRVTITKSKEGKLQIQKMVYKHPSCDNKSCIYFDAGSESDGTIRLIDLLPVLYLGDKKEKVFVIDELDRSLHPNLCYKLIERFAEDSTKPTQMIVTTHESNLLDLKLLRRDEIWFIEKNQQGSSNIYSLEEFAPRYDKDIQKGYLLGRFGAIPIMGKKSF